MATEHALPVNGYAAVSSSTSQAPAHTHSQSNELAKEEIGWYFVERYYNTLSKNPDNLYLLYNKRSQFVAGVEEEKVHVSIGLKAINDRVKDLGYHNCKVRITNVDSQSSDINIVVQVIGEMTNDSKPHRKFVQTFVLAPQPQGYFLLNDILRFIAEEDEEPVEAQPAAQPEAPRETPSEPPKDVALPVPTPAKSPVEVNTEETAKKVDEQLEEIAKEKEEEPVNGTPAEPEPEAAAEEPKEADAATPVAEEKPAEVEKPVEKLEPEKPAAPVPTPAEKKSPVKPAATPSKPAVPLSWAQRLSANTAKAAAAAPSSAPTPATSAAPPAQPKQAPAPASTPSAPANATATAAAPSGTPARQASPVDSNGDGSQGGWQMAGADHSRTKSRPQAQTGPALTENGHVRAYVKNVYQSVKTEDLRAELSKYGELAYFDVSRQKNSAFVEFATVEGFRAAVAANPHKIGNDSIVVEERRPAAFNARGGARGGARGTSFDARNQQHRAGFGKEGSPRGGGFAGNRGGRGQGQAPGIPGKPRPQPV